GVDTNHPMISGHVAAEACFAVQSTFLGFPIGGDCAGGATSAVGPGTGGPCALPSQGDPGPHLAGVAVGPGHRTTPPRGVAPGADLISIRVFYREGDPGTCAAVGRPAPCPLARTSDIMAGLQQVVTFAATRQIAAVNMSLGGGAFTSNCDGTDPRTSLIN